LYKCCAPNPPQIEILILDDFDYNFKLEKNPDLRNTAPKLTIVPILNRANLDLGHNIILLKSSLSQKIKIF